MASAKVTIRDVADKAHVSLSAVSLYLNNRVGLSDATRQRIAEAISEVGYVPRLPSAQNGVLGFVGLLLERLPFSPFNDMFYGEVIQGIESQARALGYNLALMSLKSDESLPRLIEQHSNLAGMIMLGSGDITEQMIESAAGEDFPVLLVDNDPNDSKVEVVIPDYLAGAYHATQYLLRRGCQRIAFIQGPNKYQSLVTRFHGYCCALIDAGLPLDPHLIQSPISSGIPNKGYREVRALLDRGTAFDALFCVSDRTALGALDALREAGIRVPDDILVIGFDNIAQASHTNPPLTTVHVPKAELGSFAMRRLHALIETEAPPFPIKSNVPTELIVRESA